MAIGKPFRRIDARAKATGRARYTDDFFRPGMLEAKCFRSTIAHGRVKHIDVEAARSFAGVEAVYTFEDVPANKFSTAGHPFSLDPERQDVADRLLLTRDIRFQGDEIAVVVAENGQIAQTALDKIKVEYEVYEPLLHPEEILATNAREIHEGSANLLGRHSFECGGQVDQALLDADCVIHGNFRTGMVHPCNLEIHTVISCLEETDRITIVTSTQIPHIVRRIVGEALNMPSHLIRVIKPHVGGGFGNKQDVVLEPLGAFLASKLGGRPVKMSMSREESMSCTRNRHPFRIDITTGLRKDGTLAANKIAAVSLTGAYASHGHSVSCAGSAKACSLYPRSAVAYEGTTIYSNMPVAGAMRGYGSPQIMFAVECNMEDAARKIGMDSVLFRLKNVAKQGDVNPFSGLSILSCGIRECLTKGKERIGWDEKKAAYAKRKKGDIRKGLGVACFSYTSGTYPVCVEIAGTRITLNQDGSIKLQVGAVDIGQGSDTVAAQMAAETIGVPYECILIDSTHDTDFSPFDTGAYASRQSYVLSNVLRNAAGQFKEKLLFYAGKIANIPHSELDIKNGHVSLRSNPTEKIVSLKNLAMDAYYHKERGEQISVEVSQKTTSNAPCFGCTFVDITVDIPLCRVRIDEIVNVHDSGVIINPVAAQGQVQGGVAMGIGAALMEEMVFDEKTGSVYTTDLAEYRIPTSLDIPNIGCGFIETFEPTSGYGNKALGEPPVISPPPAIRNAVLDATGVAIYELPMTPQVLFRHFRQSGLI